MMLICFPTITSQEAQDITRHLIETITENLEGDGEFDFIELGQQVEDWQQKPVDINAPEAEIFVQWYIISEYAFNQLQEHIRKHGPLLSLLELQAVPGFDPQMIRILQSISRVEGRETFTQTATLGEMLLQGINEIYFRAGRTIEKSSAYLDETPAYEGSPDKIYVRLRHRNAGTLSYGITGEKDAGETFFKGSNRHGFDFYSAHLSLQNYKPWLAAFMIGDFMASFGQGLIMHSGFGAGKSGFVTSIKRSEAPLRPYTSVDENNFLRGIAFTLKDRGPFSITAFASINNRDANIITDTLRSGPDIIDIITDVSSLQTSSLHRTSSEVADENANKLTQVGLRIGQRQKKYYVSLNALHSNLKLPLDRRTELYNQFYFNGKSLSNASLDYGFWLGGLHFFGETAMSDNGSVATLNGVLAGIDKKLSAAVLFRSYDKKYQALTPNAFGESSGALNEFGLYTGIEILPSIRWKIQCYHDMWKHPWLRFNVDTPSEGQEYFARITYTVKRRLEVYCQLRKKQSNLNYRQQNSSIPDVIPQYKTQVRFHLSNHPEQGLQFRTRLEWNYYKSGTERQKGFLIFQDVVYKPLSSPWSMSARVTLFVTDDYDTRIYTFENDLIYYYAIPAFDGKGLRYYFNIRYKGFRNLTAEIKFARTRWLDATSIGSGNDEIQGNKRSEIRGQLIYRFTR